MTTMLVILITVVVLSVVVLLTSTGKGRPLSHGRESTSDTPVRVMP